MATRGIRTSKFTLTNDSTYEQIHTSGYLYDQYINTPADLGVEGVIFVPAEKSPMGKALIISPAEVSKTVSVFEFSAVPVITLIGNDTVEVVQNPTQTITIAGPAGPFLIQNGGSSTMIAGVNIIYLPGTLVQEGGYMHGYIAPGGPWCGAKSATVVSTLLQGEMQTPHAEDHGSSFIVYPNPTQGNFTIEQKGDVQSGSVRVDIYGMQGNKIRSAQYTGQRKMACSLDDAPAGLYHIRIPADGKVTSLKVVVTR